MAGGAWRQPGRDASYERTPPGHAEAGGLAQGDPVGPSWRVRPCAVLPRNQ